MIEVALKLTRVHNTWFVEYQERHNSAAWNIGILETKSRGAALTKYNEVCTTLMDTNWDMKQYCNDYTAMSTVFVPKIGGEMVLMWGLYSREHNHEQHDKH